MVYIGPVHYVKFNYAKSEATEHETEGHIFSQIFAMGSKVCIVEGPNFSLKSKILKDTSYAWAKTWTFCSTILLIHEP